MANSASEALADRHILLGITGGIAAYKTPELVRLLRKAGAEVQVIMTRAASQFVTATCLQAVSGAPVRDDLKDPAAEAAMGHIELARWADLLLIAPATADCLARMAAGRSDDLLGAIYLATRAPVIVAPAMNTAMWQAAATQRNVATLNHDGVNVLEPGVGEQACGESGPGRMPEPQELLAAADEHFSRAAGSTDQLSDRHVVITAGPTREALDPVRYISNHSSGKQGYALACAARDAGARVTLISGPVAIPAPANIEIVPVTSALEMHHASQQHARNADLFIAVAAVADYRPESAAEQKIKKEPGNTQGMALQLVENPDIVASVATMSSRPRLVVGFAAETEKPVAHARAKLIRKKLDAIVVNDVSRPDIGFNSSDNAATLIFADGESQLGKQDKYALARSLISLLCERFEAQLAHTNPEDLAI